MPWIPPETLNLNPSHGHNAAQAGRAGRQSLLQRMRVILSSPEVSIFLVMAVLFGIGMGTIDGFMFLYLKQLGEDALQPAWQQGLSMRH